MMYLRLRFVCSGFSNFLSAVRAVVSLEISVIGILNATMDAVHAETPSRQGLGFTPQKVSASAYSRKGAQVPAHAEAVC